MICRQDEFLADDFAVIPSIRRCGREGEQFRDERRAAYLVEQVPVTQDLGERDYVHRALGGPAFDEDRVDRRVRGLVKPRFCDVRLDEITNDIGR